MTAEEFMEFYGGTRYVHANDTRALLNTDLIFDAINYRGNIFQIALQHLANDGAASKVSTQVYRDVLLGEFKPVFQKDLQIMEVLDFPSKRWSLHGVTDEDIWRGNEEFPGLYLLVHARCLCFLVADPSETQLAVPPHPDVYAPEKLTTRRFVIPAPWFFKAAKPLRAESLLHFRAATMALHYYADEAVTPHWMAAVLEMQTPELLRILSESKVIIERFLQEEVHVFQSKSENLASLWKDIAEKNIDHEEHR